MILQKISENFLKSSIYWILISTSLIIGIYSSLTFYPFLTFKTILFRLIVSVLLILYTALVLKNKDYLPKKSSLLISFFVFLVAALLSGLLSWDQSLSFWSSAGRLIGVYGMINFFVLIVILSSVLKKKETWNKVFKWWNWIFFGTSFISFVTFFSNHALSGNSIFSTRFQGFTGNPIYFSSVLLVFFFINLYLFFEDIQFVKTIKQLLPYLAIALSYIFFIILTGSRGAFVTLGATLLILLISLIFNQDENIERLFKINLKKISIAILIFLLFFTGLVYIFKDSSFVKNNYILVRMTNINAQDNASFSRVVVSRIALDCFKEKPFLGWGFDNFEICFQQHFDKEAALLLPVETRFDRAHNMPFEILATTGIIGFIGFMGIYFFSYKKIRDLMIAEKIYFYSGLSIILAVVAYFIQNLFVFDVFEGLIAISLVFSFITAIYPSKNIKVNIKLGVWLKNLIWTFVSLALIANIYFFNYQHFIDNTALAKVKKNLDNNQPEKALEIIKKTPGFKNPHKWELFDGYFKFFTRSNKEIATEHQKEYYEISYQSLWTAINERPYFTKMYILALVNIYSQVNHPEVGISTTDINRAKKIYSLSKEYNLNQPEIELYFIQTLFHSKSQEDILLAVRLTKEAITFYPERGIFNLIYGNYLAKSNQKPEEAVKQIKAGISKPGSIETIWQVVSSTTDLLSFGEADFVIETLEKYIEKNPQRHQLYMVMINAYIIKKDHELAMDNFRKAWAIYEQIKTHDKDDALKKELLDLKKQIDLLKK